MGLRFSTVVVLASCRDPLGRYLVPFAATGFQCDLLRCVLSRCRLQALRRFVRDRRISMNAPLLRFALWWGRRYGFQSSAPNLDTKSLVHHCSVGILHASRDCHAKRIMSTRGSWLNLSKGPARPSNLDHQRWQARWFFPLAVIGIGSAGADSICDARGSNSRLESDSPYTV